MYRVRLSKVIIAVFVLTAIAFIYVHQHIQVIKLSLNIDSRQNSLNYLIDQNLHMGYNNLVLKSPKNIESKLVVKNIILSRPQSWQVVSLKKQEVQPLRIAGIDIVSLLWPNAEAGTGVRK